MNEEAMPGSKNGPGKDPGMADLITPDAKMLTYGSYLKIPELLGLQTPQSKPAQHDETLFIIIHQVYELWFKQILHELSAAERALDQDELMPFARKLKRLNTIQSVLTHQVDILETMTPVDFNRFRERLNPASGFQSWQFRQVEFKMGLKDRGYLKFYKDEPQAVEQLQRALDEPTLYDRLLRLLQRRDFDIPDEVIRRDVTKPYRPHDGVAQALLQIYEDSSKHYDLYTTLEALMDFDEGFTLWRYRHIAMVQRMIGDRRGTGGSTGARYLSGTLSKRFFPELWMVRDLMK